MRKIALLSLLLLLVAAAAGNAEPVNKALVTGTAVDGYDVVAYHLQGKPREGSSRHEVKWNGATWRFATAAHKALFAKEPRRYAPQYGGFCAFGVSRGYAVGTEPDAWSIVGGKLYLNYNRSVRTEWLKDTKGYIAKAGVNWPKIVAEKKK